jgi:glucosamine--fructose-6-phosphate aminotransferase (isomerizing)
LCGIVGCVTKGSNAPRILINSLKRLEYRGYDSAGIAILKDGEIETMREVGKLSNLESALDTSTLTGATGLGHTRWATHGRPTEVNAHPHRDGSGRIVVVHNGIIENYRELREELRAAGHVFASDTDSEVIAHLVQANFDGDLTKAVAVSVSRLRGAYAIGVMHADEPNLIVGAKKDCPLVVGVGDGENFLASDVTAVMDQTTKVVYLDDGEIATIRLDSLEIQKVDGTPVEYVATTISWNLAQAERSGYPHFMLKEIHEQPTVISDTLLGRLDEEEGEIRLDELNLSDEALRQIKHVNIIACGTSWHAGHVAKFYIEQLARIAVDVDYASEFRYRQPVLEKGGLVIAISQSGETADTIAAMRMAREAGCRIVGVCNVIGSTIVRDADGIIMTHAGPEIGVASTKAFVSQLVALLLLALKLGRVRGVLAKEDIQEHCKKLRQLPHAMETVLQAEGLVRDIALKYVSAQDFLYIGRGVNYPIALEGALKLKEISYIHAEGYPAGEMKHGPIALLDEKLPVVAICTKSTIYDKIVTNVEEARVRDAKMIVIANEGDEGIREIADDVIFVPLVDELLSPLINVIPLQLLSYFVARERGCDVDQPRNLAKSVTVE